MCPYPAVDSDPALNGMATPTPPDPIAPQAVGLSALSCVTVEVPTGAVILPNPLLRVVSPLSITAVDSPANTDTFLTFADCEATSARAARPPDSPDVGSAFRFTLCPAPTVDSDPVEIPA